jgi:hypothetical protein
VGEGKATRTVDRETDDGTMRKLEGPESMEMSAGEPVEAEDTQDFITESLGEGEAVETAIQEPQRAARGWTSGPKEG